MQLLGRGCMFFLWYNRNMMENIKRTIEETVEMTDFQKEQLKAIKLNLESELSRYTEVDYIDEVNEEEGSFIILPHRLTAVRLDLEKEVKNLPKNLNKGTGVRDAEQLRDPGLVFSPKKTNEYRNSAFRVQGYTKIKDLIKEDNENVNFFRSQGSDDVYCTLPENKKFKLFFYPDKKESELKRIQLMRELQEIAENNNGLNFNLGGYITQDSLLKSEYIWIYDKDGAHKVNVNITLNTNKKYTCIFENSLSKQYKMMSSRIINILMELFVL